MPSRNPPLTEAPVLPAAKTLYVKTYGCQMNVYDSERIGDAMRPLGYQQVDRPEDADLIVLNTCHIREKAADKVYSELGRLRDMKSARLAVGKTTQIAVAGCVAQAEGAEMARRMPAVDVVVGPQSYHRLPELLRRAQAGGRTALDTEFPATAKFDALPARKAAGRGPSAFLTVQEGCDKFCTFCVVPYTRGAEFSRPGGKIIEEAQRLGAEGVREITLLGQNVNAYHGEAPDGASWTLAGLIDRLSDVPGIERIRYMTSHPRDMREDLIAEHARNPKLMPFLHLPFQSGSDRILAAMNRQHTVNDYRALIDKVRAARPDIALSTDIVVGFPGESDADFRASLDLVEQLGFALAFSFKYSARPGTPAAQFGDAVDETIKDERLFKLQRLLNRQQTAFNQASIGKTMPVLFEKLGRRDGQAIGRSPYLQAVHANDAASLIGKIAQVAISSATLSSLGGVIVPF